MEMKTKFITLLLLSVAILTGCSSKTDGQPGEIYQKYASQPGLTVAQVSDFELNDTVKIDVVLLVSDNDTSWRQLAEELDIRCDSGSTSWLAPIDQPAQRTVWNGDPVMRVIASPSRHTIGIYRIDNEEQYDALTDYQLDQISKK